MKLVVTIDTEEDNWGQYYGSDYDFENIERIGALQGLLDQYGIFPTYLVTYPVATNEKSVKILKKIHDKGRCEIGMHCHPWNTPPLEEERSERNSMLCNLPPDLQFAKMFTLDKTIRERFCLEPTSFRAGRWAYGDSVVQNLAKLDYRVDSSILPLTDWRINYGPDMSRYSAKPFSLASIVRGCHKVGVDHDNCPSEVPATVGFLQPHEWVLNHLYQFIEHKALIPFRLKGILHRLHLLNKVWLSPEISDAKYLIRLAEVMIARKGSRVLNLFFHSTTLKPGAGPFVSNMQDDEVFWQKLREFFGFIKQRGIQTIGLTDSASNLSGSSTSSGD